MQQYYSLQCIVLGKFSVAVETAACLASIAVVGVGRVGIVSHHRHVLFFDGKAANVRPFEHWKLRHILSLFFH